MRVHTKWRVQTRSNQYKNPGKRKMLLLKSVRDTILTVYIFAYPVPLQFWPVHLLPKDGNKTQVAQKNRNKYILETDIFFCSKKPLQQH